MRGADDDPPMMGAVLERGPPAVFEPARSVVSTYYRPSTGLKTEELKKSKKGSLRFLKFEPARSVISGAFDRTQKGSLRFLNRNAVLFRGPSTVCDDPGQNFRRLLGSDDGHLASVARCCRCCCCRCCRRRRHHRRRCYAWCLAEMALPRWH
jgi:hypothetical protein